MKELSDDMTDEEKQERLTLMEDIVGFGAKEAVDRILNIAKNADLGPRECVSVLVKASGVMLVSALHAGLDDDMPKDLAMKVLRTIEARVSRYEPEKSETETVH